MPENPFDSTITPSYAESAMRQVPGFASLHRMIAMLLAEKTPRTAEILVLGAGGGLELRALAEAQDDWRFDGVDPSRPMLDLAQEMTAPFSDRIRLHEAYIEDAPKGPFDAAVCLLTFHFIARENRLETLGQIRSRLRPGAPFALAHISFPQAEPERSGWIARHVAFGAPDGTDPARLAASREAIGTRLSILAPDEEEAMLAEAGFSAITPFYHALSFRGWIASA